MKKIVKAQFVLLLLGTLFAWANFAVELSSWLGNRACTLGCPSSANPFLSPCFFGALFFTSAFALNVALLMRTRQAFPQ